MAGTATIAAAVTETRTVPSTAIKRPEGCILERNVMEKQREEPNILLYYELLLIKVTC